MGEIAGTAAADSAGGVIVGDMVTALAGDTAGVGDTGAWGTEDGATEDGDLVCRGSGLVSDTADPSGITRGGESGPRMDTALTGIPTAMYIAIPILDIRLQTTIQIRLRDRTINTIPITNTIRTIKAVPTIRMATG